VNKGLEPASTELINEIHELNGKLWVNMKRAQALKFLSDIKEFHESHDDHKCHDCGAIVFWMRTKCGQCGADMMKGRQEIKPRFKPDTRSQWRVKLSCYLNENYPNWKPLLILFMGSVVTLWAISKII
jgi:hypothetical protein